VIHLVQPVRGTLELLRTLRSELAPEDAELRETDDASRLVADIQEQLLLRLEQGRSVVVAIDEAQTMPVETLESLRLLSNFETRTAKLLQVVLVGQPELDEMLDSDELRPLNQRIAVRARIGPLGPDDSRRYIEHRVAAAGGNIDEIFTPSALRMLLRESQGYPRRLNIMCDNALMNAFGHESRKVTSSIAREAIEPLTYRPPPRPIRADPRPAHREPIAFESEPRRRRPGMFMIGAATGLAALAAIVALTPPWQARMQEAFAAVWTIGRSTIEPPGPTGPQYTALDTRTHGQGSISDAPAEPPAPSRDSKPTSAAEPPPAPQPAPPAPAAATSSPPILAPVPEPPAAQLAAVAPAAAPPSKIGDRTKHVRVVRRGDTIGDLCREVYGTCGPAELKKIRDANPGIRDLSHVMVGQLIAFPVIR
jgi:general secretion pathway protein A